jgi:hypothetical protein
VSYFCWTAFNFSFIAGVNSGNRNAICSGIDQIRAILRVNSIAVKLCRDVYGLKSQSEDSSHATADGHCPYIRNGSLPVREDDRRRRKILPIFEVVVDKNIAVSFRPGEP